MRNLVLRQAAERAGVRLWEIAAEKGISDSHFSRLLRRELPDAERERLLRIIEEIAQRKEAERNE